MADWEARWVAAQGPTISSADLGLLADVFENMDASGEGLVDRRTLASFSSLFADLAFNSSNVAEQTKESVEGVDDGMVDPDEWTAFNVAAINLCGQRSWRRALDQLAAVNRVARSSSSTALPEEPWVIRLDSKGSICSKWFTSDELRQDEKAACRALKDVSGWRCLACEAMAVETIKPATLCRLASEPQSALPPMVTLFRSVTAFKAPLQAHRDENVLPLAPEFQSGGGPKLFRGSPELPESRGSPGLGPVIRCQTLNDMLSHRAMMPLQKLPSVGDRVMIVDIARCDGLQSKHLGMHGTIRELWVPEKAVIKTTWCLLELRPETETVEASTVAAPLRSVVYLRAPLHAGDSIEAYRPLRNARVRSTKTFAGTVLEVFPRQSQMVRVTFGPGEVVSVPVHWILRLEMSAWTQVLRQAPHSTLMFLLCDLNLTPGSPQDRQEFEERMRRDFEPHGRFLFVGHQAGSRDEDCGSPTIDVSAPMSPLTPLDPWSPDKKQERRPLLGRSKTGRLLRGDRGKIQSFDFETMQAQVIPDRKKHLVLGVSLEALKPDTSALPVAARSSTTAMKSFQQDPPLLRAVKERDVHRLRGSLALLPQGGVVQALLFDNTDADGNSPFHAAIYAQSTEMWRIIWTAVDDAADLEVGGHDAPERALNAVDDWGRTPLWIALELGNSKLCSLLLSASASVDQEAPVLPWLDSTEQDVVPALPCEFCGGPGLVAQGELFNVTFYRPALSCGLSFGASAGKANTNFVVVSAVGEAARACVMAGDTLLTIEDEPATNCRTFGQLAGRLATEHRPFTLRFRKGDGLWIRPLHRACELGHHEIVKLLLKHGAKPNWHDMCDRSAMDRAVRMKNRHAGEERVPFERCIEALADQDASEEGRVRVLDAHGVSHAFVPPEHWHPCDQMHLEGRFWLSVDEVHSNEVLESLQRVIDRSMGASGVRKVRTIDRKDRVPDRLQLMRAQRIENVACLCEYLQRRYVLRDAISHAGVCPAESVKMKVDYDKLAGRNGAGEGLLWPEVNEVFLFHGTSPDGALGIAHENFLLSLAGSSSGAAFGHGIYFAEDCIKSDEYTREAPNGHGFAGLRPLILCRVLLGRVVTSEDREVGLEIEEVMQSKYDSLLADRRAAVGTYREFIIFDENQANPEYILWYRRRY
mmetsp:Transcript_130434/g.254148  ORF Transcript_130434/g.254148 Transcript_130434/m.254148 type:complete len:1153 (-) Transcript_130434:353-3811(-)